MKHALLLLGLIAAPARAQADEPRFCPNRPDLGASPCTTRPGQVQFEMSGPDWELDDAADARTDTVTVGDLVARFGLGPHTEAQVSWTPYGHVRTRGKATGAVEVVSGVGDVRLAVRQNLRNPDGKGFGYALEPFVTLPVGREPIGEGDWGAGVVLPVSYDLGEAANLAFTGTAEALPDGDGDGRHLSLTGIVGLGGDLSERVTVVGELSVQRDDDPSGHRTLALAVGSVAWQPARTWQLDLLVAAGLNRDTPDLRLVAGGAVLF